MDDPFAARNKSLEQPILVIGYGNPLRSDDGIGQEIAKEIAQRQLPNVAAIAVHQLTPELAEKLVQTDRVIFVDASTDRTTTVQIHSITLANTGITSGHCCAPSVLLAMTQMLYGKHPQAWWVTVPGENFTLGESLSAVAQQGVETALRTIEELIQRMRLEACMKLE